MNPPIAAGGIIRYVYTLISSQWVHVKPFTVGLPLKEVPDAKSRWLHHIPQMVQALEDWTHNPVRQADTNTNQEESLT